MFYIPLIFPTCSVLLFLFSNLHVLILSSFSILDDLKVVLEFLVSLMHTIRL